MHPDPIKKDDRAKRLFSFSISFYFKCKTHTTTQIQYIPDFISPHNVILVLKSKSKQKSSYLSETLQRAKTDASIKSSASFENDFYFEFIRFKIKTVLCLDDELLVCSNLIHFVLTE